MSQEELLVLVTKKDERAFTVLYNCYSKSLFAVINGMLNNIETAEDVLQETFIKIWKNIDQYDTKKGRLYTWMINIARNTAIDKQRSKDYSNQQKNVASEKFVNIPEDSKRILERMDMIGIREFVKKLKPKCIEIIDLLFFKGYTQVEASEALNLPLGTVKTQNRICINDLRNYLKV